LKTSPEKAYKAISWFSSINITFRVCLKTPDNRRKRSDIFISRLAARIPPQMKETCSTIFSLFVRWIFWIDRRWRNRSTISGDTLKNDPASWMRSLSPFFSFVRLFSRAIWMDRALHLRKKKMSIESITTCACNYSLREKSTKRLRGLAHLMGSGVCMYYIFIVHAHVHVYLHIGP